MKKLYTLAGATLIAATMSAQASFSDDFESYNVGDYIGAVSPDWTTWDNVTGGPEDTQVGNAQNHTPAGSQSCHWASSSSSGGPQDCILPFGGTYTTGTFTYQMSLFIESGKGGYFNFQGTTTPGQIFSLECYMNQLGEMYVVNGSGILLQTTFPTNQWFDLKYDINLNTNQWNVYIDNTLVGTFANSNNTIGAIDIFAYNGSGYGGNNLAGFYVDDVSYNYTAYTLPALNGATTQIVNMYNALATQSKRPDVIVRNLGTTTITSFDLTWNYNSGSFTQSFTGQNIASLATTTVTMTTPIPVVAGSNALTVTISNVNGNASDGDASDDSQTEMLNPVVPAPGKVVVGEEATGTWCQWCPRGAVYMDFMEKNYDGYWAGIAVHNGDPMTVAPYDAAIGNLITGYPSELVDRGTAIDPSQVEADFNNRVIVPPVATITNGAQLNGNTLDVSISLNFPNAMSGTGYKIVCVLTEDSVTGTGGSWSQSNAYAGGGSGVMGGFESLPNPVPYTMMHYDHVARAISPSFTGYAGFPANITAGQTVTFNFQFTVPANWNTSRMHIVGMFIQPNNLVDNGSTSTIAQAISNGYVSGTTVTGISTPDQPDNKISLYPNPATDVTYASVELQQPEVVTMVITDVTGKVVAERNYGEMTGNNLLPINTTEFAKGIYMVEVRTGNTVTTSKLIVQ